jgi:hypothetical protein
MSTIANCAFYPGIKSGKVPKKWKRSNLEEVKARKMKAKKR